MPLSADDISANHSTKLWHGFFEPIEIPPQKMITPSYTLHAFVHPVVGKIGIALQAGFDEVVNRVRDCDKNIRRLKVKQ